MAAEVVGGGHTLAALGLELPDDGHAVAAGDLQPLLTQRQEGARRLLGLLPVSSTRKILNFFPPSSAVATGQGISPRTWSMTYRTGSLQSMGLMSLLSMGA